MAKILRGSILTNLRGLPDGYTICQTQNGPILRKKTSCSKSRFATDPAFAAVRNNNREFGNAGRAGKLLREAFKIQLRYAKDPKLTPSMQALMMRVVKSDQVSAPGNRCAANGNLDLLHQFDCNAAAGIDRILASQYSIHIDRISGTVRLTLPSIVPALDLKHPAGATHYRIICASGEIDFTENKYQTNDSKSGLLPICNDASAPVSLTNFVTPGSALPIFVALGIQFVILKNGGEYQSGNMHSNPLCFVKIDKP